MRGGGCVTGRVRRCAWRGTGEGTKPSKPRAPGGATARSSARAQACRGRRSLCYPWEQTPGPITHTSCAITERNSCLAEPTGSPRARKRPCVRERYAPQHVVRLGGRESAAGVVCQLPRWWSHVPATDARLTRDGASSLEDARPQAFPRDASRVRNAGMEPVSAALFRSP